MKGSRRGFSHFQGEMRVLLSSDASAQQKVGQHCLCADVGGSFPRPTRLAT